MYHDFPAYPGGELSPQPVWAPIVEPDDRAAIDIKPKVSDVLATVYDPEIPVNIYELGLIYDVLVDADRHVHIRMTLTAPGCPAAQSLPLEVERKVRAVDGVTDVWVEIVWDPPWDKDRMSETAKLTLGMF